MEHLLTQSLRLTVEISMALIEGCAMAGCDSYSCKPQRLRACQCCDRLDNLKLKSDEASSGTLEAAIACS